MAEYEYTFDTPAGPVKRSFPREKTTTELRAIHQMLLAPSTLRQIGQAVNEGYANVAQPVTQGVADAASSAWLALSGETDPMAQAAVQNVARGGAEMVIPQTPLQAGIMAGTAGAGGLAAKAGLTGAKAVGARIAGGAMGGELAGQVSGEPTGKGALIGTAATIPGEAIGATANWLKGLGQRRMAEKASSLDVENVSRVIGEIEPMFAGRNTQARLRNLVVSEEIPPPGKTVVMSEGRRLLNNSQQATFERIKQILPQNAKFSDPEDPTHFIPLDEVRKKITELFRAGYSGQRGNPNVAGGLGKDAREAYEQATQKLGNELSLMDKSGQAFSLWTQSRSQFKRDTVLLDSLAEGFKSLNNDIQFDGNAVRAYVSDPKKINQFRTKLGADWDKYEAAVFRGEGWGRGDVMAPPGGMLQQGAAIVPLPGPGYIRERLPVRPELLGKPFDIGARGRTAIDLSLQPPLTGLEEKLNP